MQTIKEHFGVYQGEPVEKYSLINKNGVKVSALTLGATWYEFLTPGNVNLIANYPNVDYYADSQLYLGMGIGPTAGRISKGQFSLAGTKYQLPTNDGRNTLHGGPQGFASINWHGEFRGNQIVFYTKIPFSYDSYPGTLETKIVYKLDDEDNLTITYIGESDKETLFNPTNHVYFTMGRKHSILGNYLQMNSSAHLQLNSEKLPTGSILKNEPDSAFDFSQYKMMQTALNQLNAETGQNDFDDAFVINPHAVGTPTAHLKNPENGSKVTIYSDRNGLVLFTTNVSLTDPSRIPDAMAMESQTLPDAINHKGFGDIVLPAGVMKEYFVGYHMNY